MAKRSPLRRFLVEKLALCALAGCGPALRDVVAEGPPPACRVATLGLAAPSVGGLRPSVAGSARGFAVAWLELGGASAGDREGIEVALLRAGDGVEQIGPTRDAAPGWAGLTSPRLTVGDGEFLLAFGGRDPRGREGIALAGIVPERAPDPAIAVAAAGGPSALGVARLGPRILVGWSAWEVDSPTVNVSVVQNGVAAPPLVLDPAPHDPALQLVVEGTAARAIWVAGGGDGEAGDVVRGAILDGEHPPARRIDLGPGHAPSVAPIDGDELLLFSREGQLALTRVAATGARTPLTAPAGHAGVVVAAPGGALVCSAVASPRGDGDDIHCTRHRGPRSDEVEVASGAYGVQALGAATVGETTALAWQQDGSDGQGMVAVALVTCR